MIDLWRRVVIGSGIAVYLVGFGVLAGMLIERVRVDHVRAAVLEQRAAAAPEWPDVSIATARRAGPSASEVER
jgi:hypothetical protein